MAEQSSGPMAHAARSRAGWGQWLAWGGLVLVLGLIGLGLVRAQAGPLSSGLAPDFSLDLYGGGRFQLSEQRGQVVMMDIWASWCIPCRDEARTLEALWQEYRGKGVIFVGVDYADVESEARAFLQTYGITYPTGPDVGGRISQAYRMGGVPEKFFIDRQGRIRAVVVGPSSERSLRAHLDALLAEPTSPAS